MRVIVQDNGSIHKSKVTQQKWAEWEAQGLYAYFHNFGTELHQLRHP